MNTPHTPRHFVREYCLDCLCVHWLEVELSFTGRDLICLGENLNPHRFNDDTHYTKSDHRGGIIVMEKMPPSAVIEWEMMHEDPELPNIFYREFDTFSDADPGL